MSAAQVSLTGADLVSKAVVKWHGRLPEHPHLLPLRTPWIQKERALEILFVRPGHNRWGIPLVVTLATPICLRSPAERASSQRTRAMRLIYDQRIRQVIASLGWRSPPNISHDVPTTPGSLKGRQMDLYRNDPGGFLRINHIE